MQSHPERPVGPSLGGLLPGLETAAAAVLAGAGGLKEPACIVLPQLCVRRTRASSQALTLLLSPKCLTCTYLALDVQASYLRGLSVNEGSINI